MRADDALLAGLDLSDVAIATAQRVDAGRRRGARRRRGRAAAAARHVRRRALRLPHVRPARLEPRRCSWRSRCSPTGSSASSPARRRSPSRSTVGDRLPVPPRRRRRSPGPTPRCAPIDAGDPAPRRRRAAGSGRSSAPDAPDVVVAVNAPADGERHRARPTSTAPPAPRTRRRRRRRGRRRRCCRGCCGRCSRSSPSRPCWPGGASASAAGSGALAVGAAGWWSPRCSSLALVDPVLRRPADRVATVFVVDGVGVGRRGRAADGRGVRRRRARRAARRRGAPASSCSAPTPASTRSMADIDDVRRVARRSSTAAATDVAGGLRLGAALLPERRPPPHRAGQRRPGERPATSTTRSSALRAAGIPVDVVTLDDARRDPTRRSPRSTCPAWPASTSAIAVVVARRGVGSRHGHRDAAP